MLKNVISKNGIALLCLSLSLSQVSFADDLVEGTVFSNGETSFVLVPNSDKSVKNTIESNRNRSLAKKVAIAAGVATAAALLVKFGPKAIKGINGLYYRTPVGRIQNQFDADIANFKIGKAESGMDMSNPTVVLQTAPDFFFDDKQDELDNVGKYSAINNRMDSFSESKTSKGLIAASILAGIAGSGYAYATQPKFAAQVVEFAKTNESERPTIIIDSAEFSRTINDLNDMGFTAEAN